MERTDIPDDYDLFEIGYCGHPASPYTHIQLEQATKLILSWVCKQNISKPIVSFCY